MAEEPEPSQKENHNINRSGSARATQPESTGPSVSPVGQVKQRVDQSPRSEDVLFDAGTEDADDDDFGDFETVDPPLSDDAVNPLGSAQQSEPLNMQGSSDNLLDLDLLDGNVPPRSGHGVVSFSQPNMLKNTKTVVKVSADTATDWDDNWGDFEQTFNHDETISRSPELVVRAISVRKLSNGGESVNMATTASEPTSAYVAGTKDDLHNTGDDDDDDWELFDASSTTTAVPNLSKPLLQTQTLSLVRSHGQATTNDRPTNIPPPSSLLQLLSIVFSTLKNASTAAQILTVHATAFRVMTGRALRWKRDMILSQSMRIGQAGKQGGMKLNSVNKAESTKEDMDVRDLLVSWSEYEHAFNQMLLRNSKIATRLKLSAAPTIKTLKASNTTGVNKQCVLCGLNRNERVEGLDVDADDLFGEFWVEHWGHKQCYGFWYAFKDMLGQR
jgi:hypothetical protein